MTKRAVLVVGPESSGTRLITNILVRAGHVGSAEHGQRLDWSTPTGQTPIVWRRSLPHMKVWPDLGEMMRYLRMLDYVIRVVTVDRNDGPMEIAQARDHVKNRAGARGNIARARMMISLLDDPQGPQVPILKIRYEELVADPEGEIDALLMFVGMRSHEKKAAEIADAVNIYDGNKPYAAEVES